VVGWTTLHERGTPTATLEVVDLPGGRRTVRVEGQSLR
jgi:hypothetical protein